MQIFEPGADDDRLADRPPAHEVSLFDDIPRWVWAVFLSGWASLFGLFALFFAVGAEAAFTVTIASLFVLMAFGLPMAMAAQSRCEGRECRGMIQTRTGQLSVRAAAIQIVLIPIAAVVGLVAFIVLAM